ncbi:hypothetical protein ACFLR2_00435 [Chlamydiota bacterium]
MINRTGSLRPSLVGGNSPLKTSPFKKKLDGKRGLEAQDQSREREARAQGIARTLFSEAGRERVPAGGVKSQKLEVNSGTPLRTSSKPDHNYRRGLSPLLIEQIEKIEQSLTFTNLPLLAQGEIQAKIIQIATHAGFSEELKLAELGILYYFLATDKPIPGEDEPSLLTLRLSALEAELRELKAAHPKQFNDKVSKLLPTGSTAYLQRVFVRMIFTPDGAFNLGGCYAIKALLNSRLNLSVTEEMRSQVLNVVDRLISDSAFLQLFLIPFPVDPEMQRLIYIDLMLPFSAPMNFVYVRWSMLTALFSVIGQLSEGNCSAISMMMNLLSKDNHVLVKLMTEVLKSGHFSFEAKMIPILPLLASKRKYETDFNRKMTLEEARGLTPYLVAGSALDATPNKQQVAAHQKLPLGKWMEFEFGQSAGIAKEFYLSHKMSFLQQALLAIFQFVSINGHVVGEGNPTARSQFFTEMMQYARDTFDNDPMHHFYIYGPGISVLLEYDDFVNSFDSFLNQLEEHLISHFFLVDYRHWDYSVKNNRVIFDFQSQGFKFNGNLDDYMPFKKARRLFHLSGRGLEPVDSLTAFARLCREHVDTLCYPYHSKLMKQGQGIIKEYFEDPQFFEDLADIITAANSQEGSTLDRREYLASDSFFLIQNGGESGLTEGIAGLKGHFSNVRYAYAQSAEQFFLKLCKGFKRLTTSQHTLGELVLVASKDHAYNMKTTHLAQYWDSPAALLDTRVINRGKALMAGTLSADQMKRVLSYTMGPEFVEECERGHVCPERMSVADFQRGSKQSLFPEDHEGFDISLNRVLQEFDSAHLTQHLPAILQGAGLDPTRLNVQELIAHMGRSNQFRFNLCAYQGARLIQKALIACSPSTFVPLSTLEQSLCNCFGYPETIELGNLNWVHDLTESAIYSYLVMVYDFAADKLVLCKRRKGMTEPLSEEMAQSIYQSTSIYLSQPVNKA